MKRITAEITVMATIAALVRRTSQSSQNKRKPGVTSTGKADMAYSENDEYIFDSLTPCDGEKVRIAFIGDSITMGYGADNPDTQSYVYQLERLMESRYIMLNYGKGSAYAIDPEYELSAKKNIPDRYYPGTVQYRASLSANADIVVIMLGTNDIRTLMNGEEAKGVYAKAMGSLIKTYEALDSVKKVYLATSINSHASDEQFNKWSDGSLQQLQKEIAEEYNVEVIDIYSMVREDFEDKSYFCADGLHPNTKGYTVMAEAFLKWISIQK